MRFPWSRRSDDDYRAEIEAHLEHEAARQVANGLEAGDAGRGARRAFGNVTGAEEQFHESQRVMWMERIGQHIRYALRSIRQRPGFTIAAVVTLAIGIGLNTAIFSIFYAVAMRSLPVREPDRLVNVYEQFAPGYSRNVHGAQSMISYDDFLAFQSAIDSSAQQGPVLSAAVYSAVTLAFREAQGGSAPAEYVSCGYFPTLQVRMTLGRGFMRDECAHPGAPAVAVLSHATWTRDFGSDSAVIGRVVRLNQIPFTVVGVAEPAFTGVTFLTSAVWIPVTMQMALDHGRDSILVRDWSWMIMAARLAPGATTEQARAWLTVPARRRDATIPKRESRVIVAKGALVNFPEARQAGAFAAALIGLLGALVVAMVCANIMNLLLARGIARRREFGIRLAIGASRARLVEQLVVEGLILAVLGGAAGFAIASGLPRLAQALLPVAGLQFNFAPDGRVLVFTMLTSLVTAMAFSLVPALHSTNVDLVSASRGGMRVGRRHVRPSRLRSVIVGVQVGGSALLLIVAALFVRSAMQAGTINPGYATSNIVTFGLNMRELGYPADRTRATYDLLRARLAGTPEVQAVAFSDQMPLLGRKSEMMTSPEPGASNTLRDVAMASVSGDFLTALQIPLVSGRMFPDVQLSAADTIGEPVVVSRGFARAMWNTENAVGKPLRVGRRDYTVSGIAGDIRGVSLGEVSPFVYLPAIPGRDEGLRIVVRTTGSLDEVERAVPRWAHELDPDLAVDAERIEKRVSLALTPTRIVSATAAIMGALAMLLAVVGVYGVVSYAVSQRTRDVAIRLALGDTQRGVVRRMMRDNSRAVIVGLGAGGVISVALGQLIRGFLLGISPLDPIAYLSMGALLLGSAFAAMYAPARRAALVNPGIALRED